MTSNYIIDRKLPDRANLKFYFPNPSEGKKFFGVEIPFFENPIIKETKKARFQKYSLISRSSNLYSYLGADSRQLSLSFNITLPHVLDEHREVKIGHYDVSLENPEFEKEKFRSPISAPDSLLKTGAGYVAHKLFKNLDDLRASARQVLQTTWARQGITPAEREYIQNLYALTNFETDNRELLNEGQSSVTGSQGENVVVSTVPDEEPIQVMSEKLKIVDVIIYWINIIRSSVVNNSQNPLYGPPVIRLRHGVLYQNVPCICKSYNISVDERAGYDLETLLPRKLVIEMKLEEFRTGDFGAFDQTSIIKKDNLAGWESVLTGPNTMDPGYRTN